MSLLVRIEQRLKLDPKTGCEEWQGAAIKGRGVIRFDGKLQYVHRARRLLEDGLELDASGPVRQTCGNRLCAALEHLVHGGPKAPALGERNGRSKLSDEQVRAIRADERSHSMVAAEYGVSVPTISQLRLGRTWRHI